MKFGYLSMEIYGLNDEAFKKYTKKAGLEYNKVKDTGILLDNYTYYDNSGIKHENRAYTYKEGDVARGVYYEKEIDIKIGGVTTVRPYGIENSYYSGGYLILNVDSFPNIEFELRELLIQSSNPDKLEEDIEGIDSAIKVINFADDAKEQKAMLLTIKIFLYGFIAVITLIGVTNIFNTITSNMELRQKEFAMLKSIGMTKKEFNRMINLETIFYGTKSLAYGLILSTLRHMCIIQRL